MPGPGDVGLVAKLLDSLLTWAVGEGGIAALRKDRLMKERDRTAQEMLKHARTSEDWAALRAYADESERLSREP